MVINAYTGPVEEPVEVNILQNDNQSNPDKSKEFSAIYFKYIILTNDSSNLFYS